MSDSPVRGSSILVLEDDRQLAGAVHDALKERGFSPTIVPSVEEGLAILKSNTHVDVIWLDHYLLGTGSGVDFVAHVKNDPETKEIPIFVVSNTASSENVNSYIRLGVNNYYTKADYNIMQIIDDIAYTLHNPSTTN
jgi:two-component system, OmpR family, phosphate regulon response regulator PhoB